ncbi:MAG: MFS transporter [Pseudomonadota bacterium]
MLQRLRPITVIALLWVAGLMAGAQFAKISVLLPEFRALYPAHTDHIAWLLTLVSVVGAVLGGFAGVLANKGGPRRLLIASLAAAGAISLWQSSIPPFAPMLVSRVLEGVTHLGIVVTAPALMAETGSERWRGATMALWSTFFSVSFALFAWFGIPALDNWQVGGLLQLHGLCLLVTAGLLAVLLRSSTKDEARSEHVQVAPASMFGAYKSVRVVWAGVCWFFYTLTFLALLTILPAQMSDAIRPTVTTAMSLVGIATSLLLVPVLLLRMRATAVVLAAFATVVLIMLLGGSLDPVVFALSLFAILGVIQGATFAAVVELNGTMQDRTLGYGVMAQTGNLGNLIGTPVTFAVLNVTTVQGLLFGTAALYVVGFGVLLVLARQIVRR